MELSSITVVTYNNLAVTQNMLSNLVKHTKTPYELIIIDNNSVSELKEWLKNYRPNSSYCQKHKVIINQENNGYAVACNQGLRESNGEYIAILNNDVLVTEGWLKYLIAHLKKNPQAGMVGPMGKNIGAEQNYAGIYGAMGYSYPPDQSLQKFAKQLYEEWTGDYTETKVLIGCCLVFKREVLNEVGLLDEGCKLSADDFDYSLRIRLAGYKLYVAEDVFVHHICHVGFKTLSQEERDRHITEGWNYFHQKWNNHFSDEITMDDLFYNQSPFYYTGLRKGRRLEAETI
ncbi:MULTISPECIES: glycosyltransferase family 2 protein [unclassified Candidatus Frackibacter]|uniref:glycosyltransferase family 2 protein n=1 Tax=unclassified Candidatus Frackibacter TaxID=2648818 RepID=UPI00079A1E37|nr:MULTISPECIES: glycosyltransferase family 2 protein [unclassified Candidatus Frackibacter]KXS41803.1 MAG: family 2 glycosyl transferase [Candidatus Frackibacter sp. T328-2]SDC55222.1 Glycosyltransferase, GT2 family [Candidatus Frackibacter sp. WG11]SEM67293.1 Glycosyltransferase, GT2 family [Candidatus Frackibacter sp. WG12]SFL78569.1 Glycosyltransferase, GT2 family [Candidatus Frackibacter sp. WG13]